MNTLQPTPLRTSLAFAPCEGTAQLRRTDSGTDILRLDSLSNEEYVVGYAVSPRAVLDVQRLRYEIFNLEMGGGFAESHATGLDQDEFDAQMTHLVLVHRTSDSIVGTYRMQTIPHALSRDGIYSAHYFDLSPLAEYFPSTVELGRLCIHPDHRTLANLHALWKGVGHFMDMHGMRWLLGCCSVVTGDPLDAWRVRRKLAAKGAIHDGPLAQPSPGRECGDPSLAGDDAGPPVPRLFDAYRRLGAKIVSEPSADPDFGTVDFLIILDALGSGFRRR